MLKDTYNVRQLMIIFCFYFSWLRVYSQKLQTSCCKECWRLNTPESTPRLQLHWNTPYKGKNHKVFEVTIQKFKSSPVGISYNFYLTVGGSDIDLLTSWNRRCRSSFDHHHIFIQCTCYTHTKKKQLTIRRQYWLLCCSQLCIQVFYGAASHTSCQYNFFFSNNNYPFDSVLKKVCGSSCTSPSIMASLM